MQIAISKDWKALEGEVARITAIRSASELLPAALTFLETHGEHPYVRFLAGRACVELKKSTDAIFHLEICKKNSKRQPWAPYEQARAHLQLSDHASAAKCLTEFLSSHTKALTKVHLDVCHRTIDHEFEAGRRQAVAPLYEKLFRLGDHRYLTVLRAFESALETQQLPVAGELLTFLGEPGDAWGHLAVARYYAAVNDLAMVERHALAANSLLGQHPIVAMATLEHLRKLEDFDKISPLLESWKGIHKPEDVALLELAAAAKFKQITPNLELAAQSSHAHRWHFIGYLYQAGSRLPEDRADIYSTLLEKFPRDPDILMCLTNIESGHRKFPLALEFSELGFSASQEAHHKQAFTFKRFELSCFLGDIERAGLLLASIDTVNLDSMQLAAVSRYYAEVGQWHLALPALDGIIACSPDIHPEHAKLVIRGARKTGEQHRFLQSIVSKPGHIVKSYMELASGLFQDWILQPTTSPEDAEQMASAINLRHSSLLEYKIDTLAAETHSSWLKKIQGDSASLRRAIFFCADKAYLLPALVSLVSFLSSNDGHERAKFFLVVEDELIDIIEPALSKISARFDRKVVAQSASSIIPRKDALATTYGLFTGGHSLAAAAYYRIYMARMLASTGDFDQILYIDSDSVIIGGFDQIFELAPMQEDTLLYARPEVDRPEVRQAIKQHGLPDGKYFNSGLLWFPRVCAELIDRLKEAERVAEQESSTLIFQDQCALNVGFAGKFSPLPEKYNFFAGPKDAEKVEKTPLSEISMMHVLDRPKPWDSSYPTDTIIQHTWIVAAKNLETVLGRDTLRPIAQLAFVTN